ncbi:MAG TPA: secretin N-terminal domain-containing protein [Methylibium sp.]|nr:secretin N-terminal domain-containing protein [Methylibium sp.]
MRALAGMLVIALAAGLAACAPGRELVRGGQRLIDDGRVEEGLAQIEQGIRREPGNAEYRMLVIRQRDQQVGVLLARADARRGADQLDEAAALYRRVLAIDPGNHRAGGGLDAIARLEAERQRLDEAQAALAQGRRDEAEQRVRQALAAHPSSARALALQQQLDAAAGRTGEGGRPSLRPGLRRPVSLEFRDANLKSVFEALSRTTGINFVFDREVKPDIKVTLSVANLSIEDVVGVLTVTNQLASKTLSENTVLVYPNTAAKQKDYVDLAVRTFFLANADATRVVTMLKSVLKTKDVYVNDRLNSLTVRDTPDAIRLVERLIAAQDLAEPEVLLDVEVLEVKRSRLSEIGIEPPGKFTVLNIVNNPSTVVNGAGGATTVIDNTLTTTQLTLDRLRKAGSASVGIDNPSVNLRAEHGDTNILANPRIRVKNRGKARILIGDRVPVITTTSTANVGVSESVSYLDVGLKLEVEPNVFLDNEVGVDVSLEVSNIVREVRSRSGTLTYQIGTRLANTALRLKDGETQALAGLISDEDRRNAAGLPWLIDLPVLGRLFSSERSDRNKTEIVLLITPRVVRNLAGASQGAAVHGGTEAGVGAPELRLHGPGRMAMPPGPAGRGPAAAPNEPAAAEPAPDAAQPAPAS